MKIVHVTETATGGVASYLNMLCDVDERDENIILVPDRMVKGIDPSLDIRTYPTTGRNLGAIWNMLWAARRLIREERPDIVYFQASFSLLALAGLRLLGMGRPAIYCSHGWSAWIYPERSLKGRIIRLVEGTLPGLANRVVVISEADEELAKRYRYLGRRVLIQNAVPERVADVDPGLFADDPEAVHVLFVGRMDRQKGLDILLPAFEKARALRPDLRLHIVGSAIRADGAELNIPEGASLSGWVDKERIDDWYASADVLVVPSRWESFGLVVAEALRNGTPVVCSNRGAPPSLIEPGVTGEVFELEEQAIVDCLISLDKTELRSRRPACRALYEARYSFPRFAAEVRELYRDLRTPRSGADVRPREDFSNG